MHTREEIEKVIPKTFEEMQENTILATCVDLLCLWAKLIDLGFVKNFEEVLAYKKDMWNKALRERLINELLLAEKQDANK